MNTVNLVEASRTGGSSSEQRASPLRRGLRIIACLVGLILAGGGGAAAQAATGSSAITTLYTSLLSGVGKGIGEEGFSWAISSIGLAGGESEDFAALSAELKEIDADLKNINTTLTEILNTIEAQTCTQTQIASSLQAAVNDITALYTEYHTYVTNAARTLPVPPSQGQVLAWQQEVLANVSDDLNAIHNGVYATVNANVIDECAKATAAPYLQTAKTATTFFDDRQSYAQLIDIVNYYYGIYLQGTTVLVEAYHLQACQFAAQNDPNLHCDFTIASTSTPASEVNTICDAPTNINVQRACLAAEETVTDPDTGAGLYERVAAWLKVAGAPFATDQLGVLSSLGSDTSSWSSSYAYLLPRDLLDFTNHATINGETLSNCASPLTSTRPCGLTVGRYDLTFSSQLGYGGLNGHWTPVTADVLLLLLAPYNKKSFGDTSGALGDFLYSIGFSDALKTGGLIVTTANTGKNSETNIPSLCFMDTASPRNRVKQPWCDNINGGVESTNSLVQFDNSGKYRENSWLEQIASQPEFYNLRIDSHHWELPGWTIEQQENMTTNAKAIYWQYHWPMTNVSDIGCQKGKPYLNPGGLLSRCAGDLQAYVDGLLPPPDSDTIALDASGDATLLANEPNRNTGEDPWLAVGSWAANEFVVHFSDERLERFLAGGEIRSAILQFSRADQSAPRQLDIAPIPASFIEGRGVGTGVTWNCAEDADVSDRMEECLHQWPAARFAAGEIRQPDQEDQAAGLIGFDVTADIAAGVTTWLLRSPQNGVSVGAYYSREGALAAGEPWRAPTLLLERWATATVTKFTGKAEKVGSRTNNAKLQVSGKVEGVGPLDLSAATLQLTSLLQETREVGELLHALSGPLLPLQLVARHGGKVNAAIFETPSGGASKVQVELKQRDPQKGELEFSLKIERTVIEAAQLCGNATAGTTSLRTTFILTDRMHRAVAVRSTQPWQCKKDRLTTP